MSWSRTIALPTRALFVHLGFQLVYSGSVRFRREFSGRPCLEAISYSIGFRLRYVWQYKLLLVHLYSYWNSLPLAYERYKSLDVKNILLEPISHHILPHMLASPMWADLNDLLTEYVKLMDDHFRESADLTFLAYRHRNYSKVIEFVQFKERLQCSNQYLMAKIEATILQLKQNSSNIDEVESILEISKFGTHFLELSNEIRIKPLTFNEDLKLRPWWTPTNDKNYLLDSCPQERDRICP